MISRWMLPVPRKVRLVGEAWGVVPKTVKKKFSCVLPFSSQFPTNCLTGTGHAYDFIIRKVIEQQHKPQPRCKM